MRDREGTGKKYVEETREREGQEKKCREVMHKLILTSLPEYISAPSCFRFELLVVKPNILIKRTSVKISFLNCRTVKVRCEKLFFCEIFSCKE